LRSKFSKNNELKVCFEYGLLKSVRPGGQSCWDGQTKHWQYHRKTSRR
jgi:hypothetical protein